MTVCVERFLGVELGVLMGDSSVSSQLSSSVTKSWRSEMVRAGNLTGLEVGKKAVIERPGDLGNGTLLTKLIPRK